MDCKNRDKMVAWPGSLVRSSNPKDKLSWELLQRVFENPQSSVHGRRMCGRENPSNTYYVAPSSCGTKPKWTMTMRCVENFDTGNHRLWRSWREPNRCVTISTDRARQPKTILKNSDESFRFKNSKNVSMSLAASGSSNRITVYA